MIDFSDFNKVLDAANSALEEMKTKTLAAKKIEDGFTHNSIMDINGNKIGEWSID